MLRSARSRVYVGVQYRLVLGGCFAELFRLERFILVSLHRAQRLITERAFLLHTTLLQTARSHLSVDYVHRVHSRFTHLARYALRRSACTLHSIVRAPQKHRAVRQASSHSKTSHDPR